MRRSSFCKVFATPERLPRQPGACRPGPLLTPSEPLPCSSAVHILAVWGGRAGVLGFLSARDYHKNKTYAYFLYSDPFLCSQIWFKQKRIVCFQTFFLLVKYSAYGLLYEIEFKAVEARLGLECQLALSCLREHLVCIANLPCGRECPIKPVIEAFQSPAFGKVTSLLSVFWWFVITTFDHFMKNDVFIPGPRWKK